MRIEPSFLFDLDGTPVDSVYQHVLAWKAALDAEKIELSVWRIHRKIGMSGGLFTISCCARLRLNRSRAW
jgi:beta-phosphoglucomutase-like phosphatase (HAD superfamily)